MCNSNIQNKYDRTPSTIRQQLHLITTLLNETTRKCYDCTVGDVSDFKSCLRLSRHDSYTSHT